MRNTKQRETIYRIVAESCDHPSADTIYERTRKLIPDVSLGTVYRNLAFLSETGKVRRIPLASGDRFDKTLSVHAHLYCKTCGEVTDAGGEFLKEIIEKTESFSACKIDEAELLYIGKCKGCLEKEGE